MERKFYNPMAYGPHDHPHEVDKWFFPPDSEKKEEGESQEAPKASGDEADEDDGEMFKTPGAIWQSCLNSPG